MLRQQLSRISRLLFNLCTAIWRRLYSVARTATISTLCGRIAHIACSVIKMAPTQTCAEASSWQQQKLCFGMIRIRTALLQPLGLGAARIRERSLLACVSAWQASVPSIWLQLCDGLNMLLILFLAHLYVLLTVMTILPGLIEQGACR